MASKRDKRHMYKLHLCTRTSHSSTAVYGLFHLVLVCPAEVSETSDVGDRVDRCTLPEAGEVVPMRDLPVIHGRLGDKMNQKRRMFTTNPMMVRQKH